MKRKKKTRRKNPIPWAIYAKKGPGPKMSFNGRKFTNNSKPKMFATKAAAFNKGQAVYNQHARILQGYRVTIEPARRSLQRHPLA